MSTEETIIGATAVVHYHGDDPDTTSDWYFSFGQPRYDDDGDVIGDSFGVVDEDIAFYCSLEEFLQLVSGSISHDEFADIVEAIVLEEFTIRSFEYEVSA